MLLDRLTAMLAAAFDIDSVHAVLVPAVRFVFAQVSEDRAGVEYSENATREETPASVAVMVPVESAVTLPMLALNEAEVVPAATRMLAGTMISGLSTLRTTEVSVVGVCVNLTVQMLVEPVITPVGLQAMELTSTPGARVMLTDCDEPLYEAVTEPV